MSAALLRVFINEDDRFEKRSLVDAIVERARASGIGGATVLKAIEGFTRGGRLHSTRSADSVGGLPLVIEIVDEELRVTALAGEIRSMMRRGLLTLEGINVVASG